MISVYDNPFRPRWLIWMEKKFVFREHLDSCLIYSWICSIFFGEGWSSWNGIHHILMAHGKVWEKRACDQSTRPCSGEKHACSGFISLGSPSPKNKMTSLSKYGKIAILMQHMFQIWSVTRTGVDWFVRAQYIQTFLSSVAWNHAADHLRFDGIAMA